MDKKVFCNFMQEFENLRKLENELDNAAKNLNSDLPNAFTLGRHNDLILDILKSAMNDEHDWIGYYLYEIDWGRKGRNCVTLKDGTKVSLTTPDKLYDFLQSEY